MKRAGIFLFCLLLAGMLAACSSEVTDTVTGPPPPAGIDKAEDTSGNNLSFPVIWSSGYALNLRGTYGTETFLGEFTPIDGINIYHQQDALNEWQAESKDGSGEEVAVDWIDWGDNLESKLWPLRSKIRVETVLLQDLATPMTGYNMTWVSGLGIDEMWGTDGTTYDATQATVYSHNARLTIQKIPDDPSVLAWDAGLHQWVRTDEGELNDPLYNSVVFNTNEGPTSGYSAEINVKGKVIYGMLWDTRQLADGLGKYRITFSFDTDGPWGLNTKFDEFTQILAAAEEEESAATGEPTGGTTHIDTVNNLTYLDTELVEGGGGGGGGGGNGGPKDDNPGGGGGGNGNGHGGGN